MCAVPCTRTIDQFDSDNIVARIRKPFDIGASAPRSRWYLGNAQQARNAAGGGVSPPLSVLR